MEAPFTHYRLVDKQTGKVLSVVPHAQRQRLRNRRDKLDNQHGGYRYRAEPFNAEA